LDRAGGGRWDRVATGVPSRAQDEGARTCQTKPGEGEPRRRAMAGTCAAPSRGRPTARAGDCAGCPGREPAALAEPRREGEGRGRGRREGRGSPWARTTGRAVPRCCGQEDDAGEGGERNCALWEKGVEQGTTVGAYRRAPRVEAAATKLPPAPAGRARRVLAQAAGARRAEPPRGGEATWPQDAELAHDEREEGEGETSRPRLGHARGASWAAAQAGLKGEERERKKIFPFLFFLF
jgi:hypothetical protein